jgi:hypothetical protein
MSNFFYFSKIKFSYHPDVHKNIAKTDTSAGVTPSLRTSSDFDFDFNILTALKGWVGLAPQGRGALHHTFQVELPYP